LLAGKNGSPSLIAKLCLGLKKFFLYLSIKLFRLVNDGLELRYKLFGGANFLQDLGDFCPNQTLQGHIENSPCLCLIDLQEIHETTTGVFCILGGTNNANNVVQSVNSLLHCVQDMELLLALTDSMFCTLQHNMLFKSK